MKEEIKKIIFVCTDNTCVGPMAESLYRSMLRKDEDFEIESRGLVVLFPVPVSSKAELVLNNHGLKLSLEYTRQFTLMNTDDSTIVLAMTEVQKRRLIKDFHLKERVYTIKEYVDERGDVVDPYGGSLLEYEECFNELARLVKKVYYKIVGSNEDKY